MRADQCLYRCAAADERESTVRHLSGHHLNPMVQYFTIARLPCSAWIALAGHLLVFRCSLQLAIQKLQVFVACDFTCAHLSTVYPIALAYPHVPTQINTYKTPNNIDFEFQMKEKK